MIVSKSLAHAEINTVFIAVLRTGPSPHLPKFIATEPFCRSAACAINLQLQLVQIKTGCSALAPAWRCQEKIHSPGYGLCRLTTQSRLPINTFYTTPSPPRDPFSACNKERMFHSTQRKSCDPSVSLRGYSPCQDVNAGSSLHSQ